MKHIQTHKFSILITCFLAFSVMAFAQKQRKEYKETFNVNDDVVIDVNTSHADIEFETWNKNIVEVEATLEVEGLSKEEADEYFKSWAFEVVGNSSKVSVSTRPSHWKHRRSNVSYVSSENFDFDFHFDDVIAPDVEIAPFVIEIPEIPEIAPLPPLPLLPMNFNSFSFDYEAYKRDGDKYLEAWKKEFNENFDEDFKENLEEWKMQIEKHRMVLEEHKMEMERRRDEMQERHKERRKKQEKAREKRELIRNEARNSRRDALEEARNARREVLEETRNNRRETIIEIRKNRDREPNIFYFSSDGHDKNLKVKKTIKIKLPKNARLKMNVRHGEVKLAENYENINAILSHTKLLASVIDGKNSVIEASYSPVLVENWNYGELKVNYVKNVDLKNVKSVKLVSKSSNIVIGNISEDAVINGSFGNLSIEKVQDEFKRLEIVLDNTDAIIVLPSSAFDFYSSSSDSKITYPKRLKLEITKKYSNQLAKGFSENKNSNKNVRLIAAFSDVIIK